MYKDLKKIGFGETTEKLTITEMFEFWLQDRQDEGFTYEKPSSTQGGVPEIIHDFPYLIK